MCNCLCLALRVLCQLAEDTHAEVRVCVAYGLEAVAETFSKDVSDTSRLFYGDVAELMWTLVLNGCDADSAEQLEHGMSKDDPFLTWKEVPGGSGVVAVVIQRLLPVVVRACRAASQTPLSTLCGHTCPCVVVGTFVRAL